jgi:hypothetical protein
LRELLTNARERGILLLEDIDSTMGPHGSSTHSGLSFSGLLNAIDGVAAQEGKLLFMTTNHLERLDNALIRPGRVDVRCEFSLCSRKQVQALFLRFYEGLLTSNPEKLQYVLGGPHKAAQQASLSDIDTTLKTPPMGVSAPPEGGAGETLLAEQVQFSQPHAHSKMLDDRGEGQTQPAAGRSEAVRDDKEYTVKCPEQHKSTPQESQDKKQTPGGWEKFAARSCTHLSKQVRCGLYTKVSFSSSFSSSPSSSSLSSSLFTAISKIEWQHRFSDT